MSHRSGGNKRKGNKEAQAVDDQGEERKEDKRSRLEPAAAAAASASSAAAAAASSSESAAASPAASAAPSAASAAASSSHPREEVEDVVCSACHEAFECADDSARLPRTLPCGHPMCSGCIRQSLSLQSLGLTPGSVLCPHEHGQLKISVPAGVAAAAVSTVEGWLRLLPPRADLIAAIRNQQLMMTRLAQKGAECAHEGCAAAVTHFCADCGDLCSTHERKRHALVSLKSHKPSTVPIAQKAAALQCKIAGPAAQCRAQADARMLQQQQKMQIAQDDLRQFEAQMQQQLQQKRKDVETKEKLFGALKQMADHMRAADDSAVLELEADRLEAEERAGAGGQARPNIDSTVLNAVKDDHLAALQTFLGADRSLSKAKLIYRATRDGFEADDWWLKCGGKSNTLTLVRVKGNGFFFGAFAPFQWPVIAPATLEWIVDSTSTTFLFSLVNAHGRAVKLRLKESDKAKAGKLFPGCGPGFGHGADLRVMTIDYLADATDGNYTSPGSFEFDSVADGGEPIPYDKTLLAGDDGEGDSLVRFAAAEIETWQLYADRRPVHSALNGGEVSDGRSQASSAARHDEAAMPIRATAGAA